MCRSVPQMVAVSILTIASVGCWIVGSLLLSHRLSAGPWYMSAFTTLLRNADRHARQHHDYETEGRQNNRGASAARACGPAEYEICARLVLPCGDGSRQRRPKVGIHPLGHLR